MILKNTFKLKNILKQNYVFEKFYQIFLKILKITYNILSIFFIYTFFFFMVLNMIIRNKLSVPPTADNLLNFLKAMFKKL